MRSEDRTMMTGIEREGMREGKEGKDEGVCLFMCETERDSVL